MSRNVKALEQIDFYITGGGVRMTAKQVQEVLGARVLVGSEHLDQEVKTACGSDLMSDVLAFLPGKAFRRRKTSGGRFP